jgi:hypothetical protein
MVIRKIYDPMTVKSINNWTGHSYLEARYFAPFVESSTLAVVATQDMGDTWPVAARVVFARKAEDATYQLDEEFWNNAAAEFSITSKPGQL